MEYEYDVGKSVANLDKHGIDFEEAKLLWDDPWAYEVKVAYKGESRYMLLARYAGSIWAAIYTLRGNATRIISVRRATKKEVSFYDKQVNEG